ncbi:MAG: DUF1836 domain-containing protein [Ruminococcus sp.]|nr:DUF1836 domain-containing protein [Ruminococcus sp.]
MTENSTDKRGRIVDFLPLIQAADGLTLSQVCALSRLEPSTIQNWIKRGYVPHPVGKKYRERHLARILLIAHLRETMPIERVGELLSYINGDTDDESDDIITEEALYDLFLDIADQIDKTYPDPDKVGETVDAVLSKSDISAQHREKIAFALHVMAFTHLSNIYKQKADHLFNERKR